MRDYYFKDGAFYPRSKWPKRIRTLLSIVLLMVTLTYVESPSVLANKLNHIHDTKTPYVKFIQENNKNLTYKEARAIASSIIKWADKFSLDSKLVLALIKIESRYSIHAISTSGALGLMQVIPSWHKDKIIAARDKLGNPELFNIDTNIFLGSWVLKDCIKLRGSVEKALACYSGNTPGYPDKVLYEYSNIKKV